MTGDGGTDADVDADAGTDADVDADAGTDADRDSARNADRAVDVVVVGGGPTGSAAAVFTARYGLDTVVFDRGPAALPRCAYLENYLGFPAGIDVETFSDLLSAHVADAGADLVSDMVESVRHTDGDDARFVVETQEGRSVSARFVVAAAWYDGSYLRPVVGDDPFERHEHDGDVHEHFDGEYADADGGTPVDGLFVAAPAGERSAQAVVAAGNGAHVARGLIADHRRDQGYPDGVAPHYDWLRSEAEFAGDWSDRDRWRDWYDDEAGDDHGLDDERYVELRERYIDRAFDTRVTDEEADARSERGLRRLVDTLGTERVLDVVGDDAIREYLAD
ncbi:FAD-dependent monooxygenase [Halobaculum sp. P14]|uniref:FAD-dependent monooxygenase n=1 Tax=Halobaculum sp. P14 TaxID=3421638 RepID=UPI003EBA4A99